MINATVENEADFDINLSYQSLDGVARGMTWNYGLCR